MFDHLLFGRIAATIANDNGLLLHMEYRGRFVCVCVCVCVNIGHVREPCKNGWTDRDAVWDEDAGGPKEPCIRWGPDPSPEFKDTFEGESIPKGTIVIVSCVTMAERWRSRNTPTESSWPQQYTGVVR